MATPLDAGLLASILTNFNELVGTVQYLIGGIFGIYVIMLVLKYLEYRIIKKSFRELVKATKRTNELLTRIEQHGEVNIRK